MNVNDEVFPVNSPSNYSILKGIFPSVSSKENEEPLTVHLTSSGPVLIWYCCISSDTAWYGPIIYTCGECWW